MKPNKSNLSAMTWEALSTLVAQELDVEYLTNAAIQGFKKGEVVNLNEKLEELKECDVHLALLTTELQRRKSSNLVEDAKALKAAAKGVESRVSRLATIRAFLLTKQNLLSNSRRGAPGIGDDEASSPTTVSQPVIRAKKVTPTVPSTGGGDEPSSSPTPVRAVESSTSISSKTDKEMPPKVCIFHRVFFYCVYRVI